MMNKVLKHSLVAIVSLIGLYLLCLGIRVFLFADFFSGPSETECVKTAEQFLGYRLGRKYEIMDYDADFSHPDRQLNFSIKLPPEKFKEVIEYCEKEIKTRKEETTWTEKAGFMYIETFSRDGKGYWKSLQILSGQDRVHYQALHVIMDDNMITFDGMDS